MDTEVTEMTKNPVSDQELVKKALNDVHAFGELIERYQQKLIRYILRISHFTSEEAEEILQESFLKAWKNLNDFDTSLSFSSWIYRIVHNQTISRYRKESSRGEVNKAALDKQLFHLKSEDLELGEKVDKKLTAEMVHNILDTLPRKYRNVLVLKFLEGKSYQDISEILKKPMGTVSTLINRAKKAFKKQLLSSL